MAGWKTSSKNPKGKQTALYLLDKPFEVAEGDTLIIALKSDNIGCARISVSPFGFERPQDAATAGTKKAFAEPAEKLDAALRCSQRTAFATGERASTPSFFADAQSAPAKELY